MIMRIHLTSTGFKTGPLRMLVFIVGLMLGLPVLSGRAQEFSLPELPESVYMFTSFRGSGDGLHMAWSEDGKKWTELESVYVMRPAASIFVDPSKIEYTSAAIAMPP